MLEESQQLFIDILESMPPDVRLFIQSPHEEVLSMIENMPHKKEGAFYVINLSNDSIKQSLSQAVLEDEIEQFMQNVEVRTSSNAVIFKGYDGMEYGEITNTMELPDNLQKHVVSETLIVARDW